MIVMGKWYLVLVVSLGVIIGSIPNLLEDDKDRVYFTSGYVVGGITNLIIFALFYQGE